MKNFLVEHKFIFLLLIPLMIYFAFGFFHLTQFETADEHFWMYQDRIHRYWQSVSEGKWKGTRINNKPGIMLAWTAGTGMLFEGNRQSERIVAKDGVFTLSNPQKFQEINLFFRTPLLIFNGLFVFYFFWIIRKLTKSEWVALMAATLILLSPTLVGVSQIVNPDALSWVFVAATIATYLAYLATPKKNLLVLTILWFGFALATKFIATILFPFMFLVMILRYVFFEKEAGANVAQLAFRTARDYFSLVFGSLVLFTLLMPAVFLKPKYLFEDVIGAKGMQWIFWPILLLNLLILLDARLGDSRMLRWILARVKHVQKIIPWIVYGTLSLTFLFVLLNWMTGAHWLNLDAVPFDSRQSDFFLSLPFYQKFILQMRPLVFSLTPVVLMLLMATWIWLALKKTANHFTVLVLSLFFLAYYAAVSVQGLLVTIRYGIILYPLAMVIAAIGLTEFMQWKKMSCMPRDLVFLLVVLASSWSLWQSAPFYFNYTSDLLPRQYVITNAWGYGGYEAATFINAQPDAGKTKVVSDYAGVCSFVTAPCVEMSNDVRDKVIRKFAEKKEDYYFVMTRRGQVRWNYVGEFKQFNGQAPLWSLNIDGRPENYIKVYKAQSL